MITVPKLIVIEGCDSTGKSTQVKILQEKLSAKLIRQPSSENIVGFLREEVKNNESLSQSTRQCLHTVSHVVDAFTEFNLNKTFGNGLRFTGNAIGYYKNIVMDRSHASTYVYGEVTGLSQDLNEILLKIHQNVYKHTLSKYNIKIIFLDREERLEEKLTDVFEGTFNWKSLRERYLNFFEVTLKDKFLFSETESIYKLNVTNLTIDQVSEKIMEIVNAE